MSDKQRALIADWRSRAKAMLADAPEQEDDMDGELSTYTCMAGALCGCANELEAALSTPPAGEWMPIASAPKDGSTYLIANALGEVCPIVQYVLQNNPGKQDWTAGQQPTRWQPLPTAEPATQEVG